MTKGIYYIGDLCYVLGDEWDEACDLMLNGDTFNGEYMLDDGRMFFVMSTEYGDGRYSDQFGKEYSVDAGSIGCIKIEDIEGFRDDLGNEHSFAQDFEPHSDKGVLIFGNIRINTN